MKQYCRSTPLKDLLSHPAGVRGLKREFYVFGIAENVSHPAGVRGLKLANSSTSSTVWQVVAPRRGAWVETVIVS